MIDIERDRDDEHGPARCSLKQFQNLAWVLMTLWTSSLAILLGMIDLIRSGGSPMSVFVTASALFEIASRLYPPW